MTIRRLLDRTLAFRWATTVAWLARGARVHPGCVCQGRVALGPGAKVSADCLLAAGGAGRIVLGRGVWLSHHVEIDTAGEVQVGDGTTVQRYSSINGNVRIGRDCIIAPSVFISSGTHPFRSAPHLPIREQELLDVTSQEDRPVAIADDCWIGVHAVIMPGVVIGKGAVIGANSVVTRDCPPYSVMAGSPARQLRPRLNWAPPVEVVKPMDEHRPYLDDGWNVCRDGAGLRVEIGEAGEACIAVPWDCETVEISLDAGMSSADTARLLVEALEPAFAHDERTRFKLARVHAPSPGGSRARLISWRCR